jgi:DNA polymerase elongation subunit (family B)
MSTNSSNNPIEPLLGKVITYEDLPKLPFRNKFLNQESLARERALLKAGKPIEFLPIKICETWLPEKAGILAPDDKYAFRMYKIAMFGILRSGEKVTVVLDGILPYFEIRIPSNIDQDKFIASIREQSAQFKVKKFDIINGEMTTKEYNDVANFIKLSFYSLGERTKALKHFDHGGYKTYHDDATCYYRVVNRDTGVAWTTWVTLHPKYKVVEKHPFFNTLNTIHINYENIGPFMGDMFEDAELRNDRTIEVNFDIETDDPNGTDDVPQPESATAEMFMISMCFMFTDGGIYPVNAKATPGDIEYNWDLPSGHLVYYIITKDPVPPLPNRVVILCKDMRQMIESFALIWNLMKPDYQLNFNGDNYDWRWIVEKARQYNLLPMMERNMSLIKIDEHRKIEGKTFVNPKLPFKCITQTTTITDPETGEQKTVSKDPAPWTPGGSYPYWLKYRVKLSAELQVPGACLEYPGYINIDMMQQLRVICNNPEKWNLHYFLKKFKLGDKVEMDYRDMFARHRRATKLFSLILSNWAEKRMPILDEMQQIAESIGRAEDFRASLEDMKDVAEYCIIDSVRCHDLAIKTQYIPDRRQIGAMSFTSMDDCVFKANGMKVRNLTIAKAVSRRLHISNKAPKNPELGKYPGAYVFPPTKGVAVPKPSLAEMRLSNLDEFREWRQMPEAEFQRCLNLIAYKKSVWLTDYKDEDFLACGGPQWPACFINWLAKDTHYAIAGLDFSSLYPSLIMTYNFSPEKMVHSLEKALILAQDPEIKLHTVNFKFNGRDINGWSVRHKYHLKQSEIDDLFKKLQASKTKTEERELRLQLDALLVLVGFGIFPSTLKELFDERKALKKELAKVTHRKEELELLPPDQWRTPKVQDEYAIIMFKFNYLNSKQKALKVYMNTFYGESGNSLSPLRVLSLAGGITTAGQYNIKMVASLVQKLGCRIYYGDSVTGDMPILLKNTYTGKLWHTTFNSLNEIGEWNNVDYTNDIAKEITTTFSEQGWTVWCASQRWTPIQNIVRHYCPKDIYEITTVSGHVIKVTEDHSLLDHNGNIIKPTDCKVGVTKLFKSWPTDIPSVGISCQIDHFNMQKNRYYLSALKEYDWHTEEPEKYGINDDYTIAKIVNCGVVPYDEYVYDITTEDGTFACGVGEIIVHNTDSVYISMPRNIFLDCDTKYYTISHKDWNIESKVAYYEAVVTQSFKEIKIINKAVNDALEADNGTQFLNMAFEEFLFPTAFFSKKKYCGYAHEGVFNPNPKEIFVRGLEYVKKGVSELLVDISKEILRRVFAYDNLKDLMDIVKDKIVEIYSNSSAIDFEKFVKTAAYKPNKANVSVHTFADRMRTIGLAPEPLDRFRYIIAKKYPFKFDVKGRKKELSIGDKMEYADRAKQLGMEVDLDYYMESGVCGQLARFVSYHPQFHVDPLNDTDEEYKVAEDKIIKAANKYITSLYAEWSQKHYNKGPVLKTIYNKVNTTFQRQFASIVPTINNSLTKYDLQDKDANELTANSIIEQIKNKASKDAKKKTDAMVGSFQNYKSVDEWIQVKAGYEQLHKERKTIVNIKLPTITKRLEQLLYKYKTFLAKRDKILEDQIEIVSNRVGLCHNQNQTGESFQNSDILMETVNKMDFSTIIQDNILEQLQIDDIIVLCDIDAVYYKIYSIYLMLFTAEYIHEELKRYVTYKIAGANATLLIKPDIDDIDDWVAENFL